MSLRVRILVAIVVVNLGVTAILASFFVDDLAEREQAAADRLDQATQEDKRNLLNIFGQTLGGGDRGHLVLEVGERPRPRLSTSLAEAVEREPSPGSLSGARTAASAAARDTVAASPAPPDPIPSIQLYSRLQRHPIRLFVEDGVIQRCVIMEGKYTTTPRGRIEASGVNLNPFGCKGRRELVEDVVNSRIVRAIESDRLIEGEDDGSVWMAAPIHLRTISERSRVTRSGLAKSETKPAWGGVYFLARRPVPVEHDPALGASLYWVMGGGTILLALLAWLLIDRWLLRPLDGLGAGARRVAERRYDLPVDGEGADEIGRLVASFNSMMLQVADFERDLTGKVEEATAREEQSRRGLVLAQRLAATGTLASGIAHEINNPLGGLRNATSRLRRELDSGVPDGELQRRYLTLLEDGLSRMQEIVRRVLTFSPRRMEPTKVSVRELVRKALDLAEHRAGKEGIRLVLSGRDGQVMAEPGEIQQVVLNLVLNAVDAMAGDESDGPPGEVVEVQVERDAERVRIRVLDEGPGIPEADVERVFDLFYSTKEVGKGTGLGLSVAHHIVEQHGGTLRVSRRPEGGAVFEVSLPMA